MQEVFKVVSFRICTFRRETARDSFRNWLWGITRVKIQDHFRRTENQPVAIGGSGAARLIAQVPVHEPPDFDDAVGGRMSGPLARCLDLVQIEFGDEVWEAFRLTVMEAQPPKEVAAALNMSPAAVRKAKSRILRRIREEFEGLVDEVNVVSPSSRSELT
jgi:RNA polymerase sigma-70 factor (ECF subfamily)